MYKEGMPVPQADTIEERLAQELDAKLSNEIPPFPPEPAMTDAEVEEMGQWAWGKV